MKENCRRTHNIDQSVISPYGVHRNLATEIRIFVFVFVFKLPQKHPKIPYRITVWSNAPLVQRPWQYKSETPMDYDDSCDVCVDQ